MIQNLYEDIEKLYGSADLARKIISGYLLKDKFDCLNFNKQQAIIEAGQNVEGFYIVVQGVVKLFMEENGRQQIVKITVENDYFGYECLTNFPTHQISATALVDSKILFIPKNVLLPLLKTKADLAYALLEILTINFIIRTQKLVNLTTWDVRGRLADALLHLEIKFKDKGDGGIILSRVELASYIGSARETTIRLLSEFKADKLIETEGSRIFVINRKKLIALSNLYK